MNNIKLPEEAPIGKAKNLQGQEFGKLTVLYRVKTTDKTVRWLCQCECGNYSQPVSTNLLKGKTLSCGCKINKSQYGYGKIISTNNSIRQFDIKTFSYLYGLFITDGYLYKRHNRIAGLALSCAEKDLDLLQYLQSIIPDSHIYYRKRNTNFKNNIGEYTWRTTSYDIVNTFILAGFPTENKTLLANIPQIQYDENSFWHGVIDGDGSFGFRKPNNSIYLSLCTQSEQLKDQFITYLSKYTHHSYNPNRNQRDNIYNIGCSGNSAKQILSQIYSNNIQGLTRKYNLYQEVIEHD